MSLIKTPLNVGIRAVPMLWSSGIGLFSDYSNVDLDVTFTFKQLLEGTKVDMDSEVFESDYWHDIADSLRELAAQVDYEAYKRTRSPIEPKEIP